ncbi:androgen-induced gene 1 protein-like isoform X1 [Babylonia areolata]|uniref:androgen-induced gene 1 protein-like isoform X1 n=1 Tax=Babylonia areolata TaxID=304850 RepID=UPI003FD4F34B
MRARKATSYGFYLCTAAVYIYSLWFNIMFIYWPGREESSTIWTYDGYGGKFKYLTFWNFILQTVYFALCVLTMFAGRTASFSPLGLEQRSSGLQRVRDVVHATLVFPVGTFVVSTFWGLYAVDRELVYPKALDSLIPSWLNHLMHTTVLPLLLVEKYLVYHQHPRRLNGIFILTAFALVYLVWVLWIAWAADLWVYPVLHVMQNHERAIFISVLLVFFICLYLLGETLTKFLWRKEKASLTLIGQKQK